MIIGAVNDRLEAVLLLEVSGPTGRQRSISAVIDTGFSGFLTLPSHMIDALALPRVGRSSATLADGSVVSFDVHLADANWDSLQRTIQIDAADTTPLVGMAMLDDHDLHVQVRDGGHVTIQRLA